MNIDEVRVIAMANGTKDSKLSKAELIKSIQLNEGNFDCFGSAVNGICDQVNCCWRDDCFEEAKK